jgi:hypothetical protein
MEKESRFFNNVCKHLNIPRLPKKEWDGTTPFDNGVALIKRIYGNEDYAICGYDPDKNSAPVVKKDFGIEPFIEILSIWPIPDYMDTNIDDMDLDEESKENMKALLEEKEEESVQAIVAVEDPLEKLPEWIYENIHNVQEAQAIIRTYGNAKGKISSNEDVLKSKLYDLYVKGIKI